MTQLIVDGRNLLWRAAESHAGLVVARGSHLIRTGGVYGFLASLLTIRRDYPGTITVAWEGRDNFRKRLYAGYKERPPDPERDKLRRFVTRQQQLVQDFLVVLGVRQFAGVGCEADDVMGTLSTRERGPVVIYTADADLRQLIDDRVSVVTPTPRGDYYYRTPQQVRDRHGVLPRQLPDLKALMGDPSDCIPGVRGVGQKTAAALIARYGSVGAVLVQARLDSTCWPVAERFREKIVADEKNVRLYRKLTVILRDVALVEVKACRDEVRVLDLLKQYQFRSLLAKLKDVLALGE